MNWTGGTLQRTKHANKGVVQKQKAHFVRARTQLQQSQGTPAAPFRPDYLLDSSRCETGQRPFSFGSGAVGQTERSAQKRHEKAGGCRSPTLQTSRRPPGQSSSGGTSLHLLHGRRTDSAGVGRQYESERTTTDADAETKLLEANKKRLLRQQDWVGVAALRPVNMQFRSIKEKSVIGKRRRLDRKSGRQTRRYSPTTFLLQANQDEPAGQGDIFMSGALPVLTAADDIRIRIGSDALTTAASTQRSRYAQSQTDSDSMLFDEEDKHTAQQTESDVFRDIAPANHVHTAHPGSYGHRSDRSDRSYSPHQSPYGHHDLMTHPDFRAAGLCARSQTDHESEATAPSYRLTHNVRGVECPLKLTFGRRSPSTAGRAASATHQICELLHVHADSEVEGTRTGCASRNLGEISQLGVRRQPNPQSIDDDEPWRPYLDTGTSSSGHVRVDEGTGTSVPQPHRPARDTQADCTSWPQHTAYGDLTHVNLKKVPAHLPAVTRRIGQVPDARPIKPSNAAREGNNDEALWQAYILGSDLQSTIETIHTQDDTSEDSRSCATKGYASTRLPISDAVITVSSTPLLSTSFRSLSGQASRMSDDLQYAPQVESRPITSAAPCDMWGYIESPSEDVQNDDRGEDASARGRFGEHSTHASMQNHASDDSAMFSNTRTSRSDLDQRGRAWDDVSRCGQASESVVWRRGQGSSMWDGPSTDEAGIDLVDVDRLT